MTTPRAPASYTIQSQKKTKKKDGCRTRVRALRALSFPPRVELPEGPSARNVRTERVVSPLKRAKYSTLIYFACWFLTILHSFCFAYRVGQRHAAQRHTHERAVVVATRRVRGTATFKLLALDRKSCISRSSLPLSPPHTRRVLVISALIECPCMHYLLIAYNRMPTGACDPMSWPIHICRSGPRTLCSRAAVSSMATGSSGGSQAMGMLGGILDLGCRSRLFSLSLSLSFSSLFFSSLCLSFFVFLSLFLSFSVFRSHPFLPI